MKFIENTAAQVGVSKIGYSNQFTLKPIQDSTQDNVDTESDFYARQQELL